MATSIMMRMVMVVSSRVGMGIELSIATSITGIDWGRVHIERMPAKHAHLPESRAQNASKIGKIISTSIRFIV
jgi:hypothetical protein